MMNLSRGTSQTSSPKFPELEPAIAAALKENPNVPRAIVESIIAQESQGRNIKGRTITDPKSKHYGQFAYGPMQLMPDTAADMKVDRTKPDQNVLGGVRYLSKLWKLFKGDADRVVRNYYGTGEAPKGDPTTDQYAAQVLDRAGKDIASAHPVSQAQAQVQGAAEQDYNPYQEVLRFYGKAEEALRTRTEAEDRAEKTRQYLKQKYESIDSMDRQQKLEALSHPGVNPLYLGHPYDRLMVSFDSWPKLAHDALMHGYNETQRAQLSEKYWENILAPAYADLNIAPMSRETWRNEAFRSAMDFKLENGYNNTLWHNLKTDWAEGAASTSRGFETLHNLFQNFALRVVKPATEIAMGAQGGWIDRFRQASASAPKYWTDSWNPNTLTMRNLRSGSDYAEFWSKALPTQGGWVAKVTAFPAEMLSQAPLFAAMSTVTGPVGNLTERLTTSVAGRYALKLLLAGGEGTAYGVSTRPKGDKHNAWQDAIQFAIWNTAFDIGAAGIKAAPGVAAATASRATRAAQRARATLKDIVNQTKGAGSPEAAEIAQREEDLNLAQNGRRRSTAWEQYDDFKKETANNIAAGGIPTQQHIFLDAIQHIRDMEAREAAGEPKASIEQHEKELREGDPGAWSPVLAASNFVRILLGNRKLSDLKMGSQEYIDLTHAISQHITDSAAEILDHVPEVAEHEAAASAQEVIQNGAAKETIETYRQKVRNELAQAGALQVTKPEHIEALAQQEFRKALAKAQKEAAKKARENGDTDQAVAKVLRTMDSTLRRHRDRVVAEERSTNIEPAFRERTRRGKDYVSYSIAPDYKVYMQNQPSAPKNFDTQEFSRWLADFYEGLDDKDFALHLEDNFYPQELKKADIWFEHQTAGKLGHEYPNFLAFMRNYDYQMPAEMRAELDDRLEGTQKFQKAFTAGENPKFLLDFYTRGMYNHMDDFLGSGRWPNESNIFKSSYNKVLRTTRYQFGLLKEKMAQEEANLTDALSGHPEALTAALMNLRRWQTERMEAFNLSYDEDPDSRETVHHLNELITEEITKNKAYTRWKF